MCALFYNMLIVLLTLSLFLQPAGVCRQKLSETITSLPIQRGRTLTICYVFVSIFIFLVIQNDKYNLTSCQLPWTKLFFYFPTDRSDSSIQLLSPFTCHFSLSYKLTCRTSLLFFTSSSFCQRVAISLTCMHFPVCAFPSLFAGLSVSPASPVLVPCTSVPYAFSTFPLCSQWPLVLYFSTVISLDFPLPAFCFLHSGLWISAYH